MADSTKESVKPTDYTILYRLPGVTTWSVAVDDQGVPKHFSGRGAPTAMRRALAEDQVLADAANTSVGVELLPVPSRSYNPVPVRLVVQDPVIKIG